jgi:hypothetical protein
MKHLATWGTIISATTLLAACATNLSDAAAEPDDLAGSSISLAPREALIATMRADDAAVLSDYTGSDFAITILPQGEAADFTYRNLHYTHSDDLWVTTLSTAPQWQGSMTPYTIYAYAPAEGTSGEDCATLSYDLSTDDFDLLWGSQSGTPVQLLQGGRLPVVMHHQFCLLQFVFEWDDAATAGDIWSGDLPITALSFTNSTGRGTFNLPTGTFTDVAPVTITIDDEDLLYGENALSANTVIAPARYIAPGTQQVSLQCHFRGKRYTLTDEQRTYESGKCYVLHVRVGA